MTPLSGRMDPNSKIHHLLFYPVQKTTDVSASEFHLFQVPMKINDFYLFFNL